MTLTVKLLIWTSVRMLSGNADTLTVPKCIYFNRSPLANSVLMDVESLGVVHVGEHRWNGHISESEPKYLPFSFESSGKGGF